ncbi:MAG: TetR/AcrR family transcriptional regulator [Myxococcota bacterium]|nr:TetR/AcrR family transcriptional regulator [Myxococcota bacterium]
MSSSSPDSRDPVRDRVLAAASDLLRREGPHALANRRVAAEAGCTTMAIYSRFGGKQGLVDALYREGLDVLAAAQADAAEPGDPRKALLRLTHAYRRTALAHPGHYAVLFGDPIPGFQPSDESRVQAIAAFGRLEAAVGRCLAESDGEVDPDRVRARAFQIFAACHGLVSIELAGQAEPLVGDAGEGLYESMVLRLIGA